MARQSLLAMCFATVFATVSPQAAYAHSVRQTLATYGDNKGLAYHRIGYGSSLDIKHSGGTETVVSLTASRDIYQNSSVRDDDYSRAIYRTGHSKQDSMGLAAAITIEKVNEVRILTSLGLDTAQRSETGGVGFSRWLWHESLRASIDLSRSLVERPVYQVLDVDARLVGDPAQTSQTGIDTVLRHLATPTTIVDYGASVVSQSNRPLTRRGRLALRQYVPFMLSAVHANVERALSTGRLTTETSYGEVDSWEGEIAYLQSFSKKNETNAKLTYRIYKEDEKTRAFEDHLVFGSDTVTLALVHQFRKGELAQKTPVHVDAAVSRYLTNTGVVAQAYELGLEARF